MTTGLLAAPARAVSAVRPGGTAAPALGRPLLLAVLASLATLAAGLLPERLSVGVAVTANFLAVVVVLVLLARAGRRSAHPDGWRWYAFSVALGAAGALAAGVVLPWGQTALGSVPGQLLVVVAMLRMLDRASLRAASAQMVTMLVLFVVADLLTVHTIYRLTIGGTGVLPLQDTLALFALLFSIAIGTGLSLVFIAVSEARQRRIGWLLFASQVATAQAGAFSSIATGPGPVQYLACSMSVLGLALLAVACRADRPQPAPDRRAAGGSLLGALLPHATALVGGSLLLLSVPITGHLTIFGTALGVLGLGALLAHQTVSWRTQQRLTRDLQRSEAYFATLVRGSADPVLILDDQLRIEWVSPAITELLGVDPQRIMGQSIADAVHPDDAVGLLAALSEPHAPDETKTRTARVRHLDGRWRLIQSRVRDLRNDPDVGGLVLYCRDVSAAAAPEPVEPALATFSATDPTTGLPNRSALTQRLAATLKGASVHASSLVVLGVDGLADGEDAAVLRELTTRFTRVLRGDDWLARAGVSEFAVVVDGTIADAEIVASRLVAAVEPVATGPWAALRLNASAGVTALSADADAGETLRWGDLALRSARAAGPGRIRRHSDALRITQDREEALRADLVEALRSDGLHLAYQPVVDLALHRTTSVEALLRWRHPVYGDVSPAEFIPLAEESSLITEIGRWVLTRATATIAGLSHPDLGVAVNVSARHVRSGELVDDVLAALESSGLPASRLVLEITESVLLDDAHVVADLQLLRRLGVRIAVDDFGTGWSSLAYLVGLPIDVLKMDRQFLADVETDPQRRALCASVLHLGTSLGLAVVVEGVETPVELQLLRDMGHRFIQGYLMSRPVPVGTLVELLDQPLDTPHAPAAERPRPVGARFPRTER